jgi:hypothetical protein
MKEEVSLTPEKFAYIKHIIYRKFKYPVLFMHQAEILLLTLLFQTDNNTSNASINKSIFYINLYSYYSLKVSYAEFRSTFA